MAATSRRVTRSMATSLRRIDERRPGDVQVEAQPTRDTATSLTRQQTIMEKTVKRERISRRPFPSILEPRFGLIQEKIAHNLYLMVVQAVLWNQTAGLQARPVFYELIDMYPDPASLASASLTHLTALLRPLGLHNIRAKRCIALAQAWLANPPSAERRYRRKGYPLQLLHIGVAGHDEWEIAHLPGVGPYALDSFRIFHRDELRGLAEDWLGKGATEKNFEPEWKRVVPLDKELRAYLRWMWLKEGFLWDELDGSLTPANVDIYEHPSLDSEA